MLEHSMSNEPEQDESHLKKYPESMTLLQSLYEQRAERAFCDVQLNIRGSVIWAHACVLASCSSYFMECLQPSCIHKLSWENHWCLKRPLIIDLDRIINITGDVCLVCVSKIIDFMYIRELVVLKEHFQHFSEIVRFLKVSELLPLCGKHFSTSVEKDSQFVEKLKCKTDSVVEVPEILQKVNDSHCGEKIPKKETPQTDILSLLDCEPDFLSTVDTDFFSNTAKSNERLVNNVMSNGPEMTVDSGLSADVYSLPLDGKYNDGQDLTIPLLEGNASHGENKRKCEFVCCNMDSDQLGILSPSGKKQCKRRKMVCETCQFSSISIPHTLRHIKSNYDHLLHICPVCNTQLMVIDDIDQHLKDHDNVKPFFCLICKKRSRFWESHNLHMRVHCRNKQFQCEICQKSFRRHQNLTAHLLTHEKKYLCGECNYVTLDKRNFKSHIIEHKRKEQRGSSSDAQSEDKSSCIEIDLKKHEVDKQFHCQVCREGFTQEKNLQRHMKIKHLSMAAHDCTLCNYSTKRSDLLRHHMKKHHGCLPLPLMRKTKIKNADNKHQGKSDPGSNEIVGVLIPVQLVPTTASDTKTLNAFAVKACKSEILSEDNIPYHNYSLDRTNNNNLNGEQKTEHVYTSENNVFHIPNLILKSDAEEKTVSNDVAPVQVISCPDIPGFENDTSIITEHIKTTYTSSQGVVSIHIEETDGHSDTNLLEKEEKRWLNETTGEFLSECNVNLHIGTGLGKDNKSTVSPMATENATHNLHDPLKNLIFNDTSGLPGFDLIDDVDDVNSNPQTPQNNPQTPQKNVMDIDEFLHWNCIDNSFSSTWVLNEATGELNLVRFGTRQSKKSDKFDFNDKNKPTIPSVKDDDEDTALFLNEGTGDLSVIYFNPKQEETDASDNPKQSIAEPVQERMETLSEHSHDEGDKCDDLLLDEEFLLASAKFIANDGNETFLNELTGEFDSLLKNNFNCYKPDIKEESVKESKSLYLNEETGEISCSSLDQNANCDLFTNRDSLKSDLDDPLNCEDFEWFPTHINDFPSNFCMDTNAINNWQGIDDSCDKLLNESTGEFINRI